MNIFENATRKALRFPSSKGQLTTEQLWDLSLTNINKIAMAVNSELKNLEEESFVEIKPNPHKSNLKLQLDILKHIISVKLAEKEAQEIKEEKANKKRILLEALEAKENEEVQSMSKEEILKTLDELS
jgi:hypothetical protein